MRGQLTITPGVASGSPCIGSTGTAAWAVTGCIWAGDSVDSIAEDYGVSREDVLVACWFVATYGVDSAWWTGTTFRRTGAVWRKRWGQWAAENSVNFWRHQYDAIPDPPSRED